MQVEKQLRAVSDGEVLAADVVDGHGNPLLVKGTTLTRAHLQLLERRAIATVCVVVAEELPSAGAPARAQAQAEAEAEGAKLAEYLLRQERVFAKVRQDPRMEAVYQAARSHLAGGYRPPA